MDNDIFNFEDFLKGNSDTEESNILKENITDSNSDKIDILQSSDIKEEQKNQIERSIIEDDILEESIIEDDIYYNVYNDKSEDFCCDISIQGASQESAIARLVIESEDWCLMFNGEIKNGKCTIPIRKLNILKEGLIGNIKLEVITEGNIFTPWEDKFKVNISKKVTIKLNENKATKKPEDKIGVKVGVNIPMRNNK